MERRSEIKEYSCSLTTGEKMFFRNAYSETDKAILILHGGGEHGGRYIHLIKFLLESSYSVFIPDLPGHGRSGGRRGHIDKFSDYLLSVRIIHTGCEGIRRFGNYQKIHLIGHSMGGLIAARYVQDYLSDYKPGITSLILSSPLFGWGNVPIIKVFAGNIIGRIWPKLKFKNPVNPEFLSHDENDPLVYNFGTARLGAELTKNFKTALKEAPKIKIPTLVLLGGDDKIIDSKKTQQFFERIGTNPEKKHLQIFPGFYHGILNEMERDEPLNCLREWLREIDR